METGIKNMIDIPPPNTIIENKPFTKEDKQQVENIINTKRGRPRKILNNTKSTTKRIKRKYTRHNTINKKAHDELIKLSTEGNYMLVQYIPECTHCKEQASIHVSVDDRVNEWYCNKHGKWTKYLSDAK